MFHCGHKAICWLYDLKTDLVSDMASHARKVWCVFTIKPPLGEHSGSAVRRKQCKRPEEMMSMKNKRCRCGKAAQCPDGEAGDKAVGCKDCKASEMVNVTTRRCQCGKVRPIFGEVGGKAVCCKHCRKPGMVDLKNKRCRCGKARCSYGEAGG